MFPTEGRKDASQDFQELLEHLIVSRSYEVEQARKLRKSQRDRANIVCQRNATYCQVLGWTEVNTPDSQYQDGFDEIRRTLLQSISI